MLGDDDLWLDVHEDGLAGALDDEEPDVEEHMPALPGLPSRTHSIAPAPPPRRRVEPAADAAQSRGGSFGGGRESIPDAAADEHGDRGEGGPHASAMADNATTADARPGSGKRRRQPAEGAATGKRAKRGGGRGGADVQTTEDASLPAAGTAGHSKVLAADALMTLAEPDEQVTVQVAMAEPAQPVDELATAGPKQPQEVPKRRRGRPPKASGSVRSDERASQRNRGRPPSDGANAPDQQQDVQKRKPGRPSKAKASAPDQRQDAQKRRRGRTLTVKQGAAGVRETVNGGEATTGGQQEPKVAESREPDGAVLDTAAMLLASQRQMADIEAALAEDDDM